MPGLSEALAWIQSSTLGAFMRQSGPWTYAIVNLAHILGVSSLFGSILVLDLRLLGVWRQVPLDVLSRAAKLFDKVTVAVAESSGKAPLFSSEQRVEMIAPNLVDLPHVSVTTFRGLLVEFCMAQKADAIIRGLRALSDFEFEFNMALMNRHLEPKLETLFVMPNELFSYTSSSLVKQVATFGGDVTHFVPPNVAAALKAAFSPVRG